MALDSTWSWRTSFVNHSLRARKKVPTITRSGTFVRRRTKQKHRLEGPRINQKPTQVFIKLEQLPPGALYPDIVWGNLTSENTRRPKSLRLSAGTAGPLRRAVRRWANRDRPIDRARRTRPRRRRSPPFALRRIDCRALAHHSLIQVQMGRRGAQSDATSIGAR